VEGQAGSKKPARTEPQPMVDASGGPRGAMADLWMEAVKELPAAKAGT
jgi:hypothetical protein